MLNSAENRKSKPCEYDKRYRLCRSWPCLPDKVDCLDLLFTCAMKSQSRPMVVQAPNVDCSGSGRKVNKQRTGSELRRGILDQLEMLGTSAR